MAILTSPRIIGQVSGDLTGSVFSPQVISIVNITTGTLGLSHGGTGLSTIGASGSVLTSNGTSLVYASVSGSGAGGISQAEVSGAITSSLTNYIVTNTSASLLSLAASTGSFVILSASSGVNLNTADGSYIRATNGHTRIYAASNSFITASNNAIIYAGTDINLIADDNINLSSSNVTTLNAPEIQITGGLRVSGVLYGDGSGLTNVGGGITANQATTAYDRLRFVTSSVLNVNGAAEINLTTAATSGSTYFNTASLTNVTVDVMVDTNSDGRYKYELLAIELFASASNLWVLVDAPGAANKNYRLIAINEASNKFTFGS